MKKIIFIILVFFSFAELYSNPPTKIELPSIFCDHMVLQRDKKVEIWGNAPANTSVTVQMKCQTKSVKSNKDGNWKITLDPMTYGGPYEMKIITNKETLTFNDVLVGDVFLAGGQSNMAYNVDWLTVENKNELFGLSDDKIRHYTVARIVAGGKLLNEEDKPWTVCDKRSVYNWSAVALYFAHKLRQETDVPIGIVCCNHGGSPLETWISPEAYSSDPLLEQAQQKQHPPEHFKSHYRNASELYNKMLKKTIGYEIAGVIWYQGEDNVMNPQSYETLFSGLITDWRNLWKNPDLPFAFVQLPNYTVENEPTNIAWTIIREAQFNVWQKMQNTAMIGAIDVGELNDIHPKNKKPVGERLALAMSNLLYKSGKEYSGPVFKSTEINKNMVYISYSHAESLKTNSEEELTEFEICSSNETWKQAKAVIDSGTVKVWSDEISNPTGVRYAWKNDPPNANLYNSCDLPAIPFSKIIR